MTYSLVILSRNRANFLRRLLGYYRECGLTAHIFLGDSSSEQERAVVHSVIEEFKGALSIDCSFYNPRVSLVQRLHGEYAKVNTPYVAWVGDDDFLLPEALEAGARLLDRRADCAAVIGQAAAFSVRHNVAAGTVLTVGAYLQQPVEQHLASERLLGQARQGSAFTYSLRRTGLAQRIYQDMERQDWPDDVYGYWFLELMDGFVTAIYGKVVSLHRLKMVRQVHPGSSAAIGWSRTNTFRMLTDQACVSRINSVAETLSDLLVASEPQLSQAEARRVVELALWTRVRDALVKGLKRELQGNNGPQLAGLGIRRFAKKAFPRIYETAVFARQRLRQRMSLSAKDYAELKRVMNTIQGRAEAP